MIGDNVTKEEILSIAYRIQKQEPEARLGQVIFNYLLSNIEQHLLCNTELDCFESVTVPHDTLDWVVEWRSKKPWRV